MTLVQPESENLNKYRNIDHDSKDVSSRFPDFGPCEIGEWKDFLLKSKEKFDEKYNKPFIHRETLSNFGLIKRLGIGSYGHVILIKNKNTKQFYAMKMIEKEVIIKRKQLEYVKGEKKVLQSIDFPFSVYLLYFFKDNGYIYFVMPFIPGGELYYHLQKSMKFNENLAKFYISQVILAIEYLHYLDIIYRDIKPENILMDHTGYLKMTDFGLCKHMTKHRTYTLCGTPEYLAPEMIQNKGYGKSIDWWGVGVLLYELVAGKTPFVADEPILVYRNILLCKYNMPRSFSAELKDLVNNLLQPDLTRRFGNLKNGPDDIKNHKWFKTINWMAILRRTVTAPYTPFYVNPENTDSGKSRFYLDLRRVSKDQYTEEFADL